MGDAPGTWGISDPTFLLAYLVIAAAVWVAGARSRRALAETGADRAGGDLAAHPHDVAHLNGGPELAVYSALARMHVAGTITTAGRGSVQAAGRPEPGTDALERAIHLTAAGPVPRHRLQFHRPVGTALRDTEARLLATGLLLPTEQRRRIRAVGWWMVAVAGLGLVRLLAGIAEARPVGFLVVALVGATAVGAVQLARAPRRSRSGDELLDRLRREHHALDPAMRPDWAVYGPAGAALGVGVFGMGALWTADPAFADELAAQKVVAAQHGVGGAAGWSGSSCGGGAGADAGGGGG
jgi:uncharacterized protein (TIGR04222 family)